MSEIDPELRDLPRPTKVHHSKVDSPRYLQALVTMPDGTEVGIVSDSEDGADSYIEEALGRLYLWVD